MNNLFLSHHIGNYIKGEKKWIAVLISLFALLLFAIPLSGHLLNFLNGNQIHLKELVAPFVIIYGTINLAYAMMHTATETEKSEAKTNTINSTAIKASPKRENEQSKTGKLTTEKEFTILNEKNYAKYQTRRPTPSLNPIEEAPPLEVNFESASELIDDEEEFPTMEYSGEINEEIAQEEPIEQEKPQKNNTPTEDNMFDKNQKKKFL